MNDFMTNMNDFMTIKKLNILWNFLQSAAMTCELSNLNAFVYKCAAKLASICIIVGPLLEN